MQRIIAIRSYRNSVPKTLQTKKPSQYEKAFPIGVEIIFRDRRNSNQ
jgi:hypothetical protein